MAPGGNLDRGRELPAGASLASRPLGKSVHLFQRAGSTHIRIARPFIGRAHNEGAVFPDRLDLDGSADFASRCDATSPTPAPFPSPAAW